MSFKNQGLTAAYRLFIDKTGDTEVLKAELVKNGVKTVVTIAEV